MRLYLLSQNAVMVKSLCGHYIWSCLRNYTGMKMTVKSHLNVKHFTQKAVVLAVVSALMFIAGGFLVKEYKINTLGKKEYKNVK